MDLEEVQKINDTLEIFKARISVLEKATSKSVINKKHIYLLIFCLGVIALVGVLIFVYFLTVAPVVIHEVKDIYSLLDSI